MLAILMARIATPDDFSKFRKAHFVICDSCFWCASVLQDGRPASSCPLYNRVMLECVPIAKGESYTFDYNLKSGVILEFVAG